MKPSFALDFRDGAVALLHRTSRGWMTVGQTSFDSADLDEALSFLRSTALGLSPGRVSTKLIIPNDQIKYLSIHAPGPDAAKRRKQIAAALVGRTPYDVADLVFDWWGKGDEVNVAVIARETLAEAEAFAHAHRFNPLAFVGVPENGIFQGEPWFGMTEVAGKILAEGEKVDRDQDPVRIIGRDAGQQPEPAPRAPDEISIAQAAPEPAPPPAETLLPQEVAAKPAAPVIEEPAASVEMPVETPAQLAPSAPAVPDPEPEPAPVTAQNMRPADPAPAVIEAPPAPAPLVPEEAPMAIDVDGDPAEPTLAPPAPRQAASATAEPEGQGFSLLRSFATRRKEPAAPAALKAEPSIAAPVRFGSDRAVAPRPAAPFVTASVIEPPMDQAKVAPESAGLAVIGAAGARAAERLVAERPSMARPLPTAAASKGAAAKNAKGLKGFGVFVTAPGIAGAKKPRVNIPQKPADEQGANPGGLSPARAGTRPIGLGARPVPQRGKPRYLGLILTGVLLVLLALVAAWASFFLASNQADTADTAVAAVEQPLDADIPAPEDEMIADMQDPSDFTEAEAAEPQADPAAAEELAAADPVLEVAPQTGLVSQTGASAVSPAGDAQDEIFLAAIDTPPQPPDPSALGAPAARTDAAPLPALPPPAFGTVYEFDADGRIIPTPEGIATPEGVLLVAGKPPVVPTPRTAAVVAAVAAAQISAAVPGADVLGPDVLGAETAASPGNPSTLPADPIPQTPVFADPALQGFRPQPRPPGLQGPSTTGTAEDPALAPEAGSRFSSLRPQKRPDAVAALAAPSPGPSVDQAAIEGAVQSASLVTGGEVLPQDRSLLAVSVSRIPAARPAGVQIASAAPAASPGQEASASTASAPEADAEPEQSGAMPNLPTSASVAKQATVKDAINLSKLTLIGIYGTEGSRYALVRQPNGRLVKVKVGDRLDGGKVAAITTSALTYQKGGRAVSLEMPRT